MNQKDKDWIQEELHQVKLELRGELREIQYKTLMVKEKMETPPILFEDSCIRCSKLTLHRSFFQVPLQEINNYKAATAMIYYIAPKPLLKVCLSCGKETYVDEIK